MKRFFLFPLLAACVALGFVSCSKDDNPDIPAIGGIENAEDGMLLSVGQSITFKASVAGQAEYLWTLDGKSVSNTVSYSFTADKAGEFSVKFTATNASGSADKEFKINVVLYKGGFFVLNEGSYGRTMGTVDYFADAKNRTAKVYQAANPGKELGNTAEDAVKWNGNFYFVSKQGRTLVKASAVDFKDGGTFGAAVEGSNADGRSFAGIDANYGVYTTANGAYVVDLNTFKSIKYLEGSKGTGSTGMSAQCGGAMAAGDYIFVINVSDGVLVYKKSDQSFVRNICPAHIGFARSKDGSLWVSDGTALYAIDPKTLAVAKTELPQGLALFDPSWAWKPGMFDASATENVLYFANAVVNGYTVEARDIYRYEIGNLSSLSKPFAKGGSGDYLYGSGFRVDPVTGDIVAIFTASAYGGDENKLVVFDGKTGAEKSRLEYKEYVFPTMVIFN